MSNKQIKLFEQGFGTAYTFVIILFVSTIIIGLSFLIMDSRTRSPINDNIAFRRSTQETAERIINAILEDNTPGSDSVIDPVQELVKSLGSDELTVSIIDVSSRLNPNFVSGTLIENTTIANLIFANGHSMSELENYRTENGMSIDLESGYPEFFSEEVADSFISPYGYANINIADEASITEIYKIRSGDDFGAESFRNKVKTYRSSKTIICNNEIESILGSSDMQIYPVINAVPVMNIHFISEELLTEILSYDFGDDKIKYPDQALNRILLRRKNGEIGIEELESIFLKEDKTHVIYDYLGTKTWFWEIKIKLVNCCRTVVVAETPDPSFSYRPRDAGKSAGTGKRTLQIISNIFYNEPSK